MAGSTAGPIGAWRDIVLTTTTNAPTAAFIWPTEPPSRTKAWPVPQPNSAAAAATFPAGAAALVKVSAVAIDSAGNAASYERTALFKRPTGGALAQVGATTAVSTIENVGAWDVTLGLSGTGNQLQVSVTGDAVNATRWLLSVELWLVTS